MSPISSAVIAVPSTLLAVGSVAGATAQITKSDPNSVRKAVYLTGGAMLVAAALSQSVPAVVAVAMSVAIVMVAVEPVWFTSEGNDNG